MNGQVWGFAPLALLILAGLLIVAKHWPWKKGAEPAPQGVRGPTPAIPIARGDPEEALPVEEQRATLKLRLKEARETAEAEVRTLRTDLGVATVRADTRETEARDLKLALEQSQGTIRALAWRLNYQAEFPLLPPIDEADLRGMVAPVDQCIAAAHHAAEEAEKVLSAIAERMNALGEQSAGWFLADFMQERVRNPLGRTTHLLNENRHDSRAALVTFTVRYQIGRRWIRDGLLVLANAQAPSPSPIPERVRALVSEMPRYREWWNADGAFFNRLDELLVIRHVASVRGAIQMDNDLLGHGRNLPAEMRPSTEPPR
jgi:hypothetical protein